MSPITSGTVFWLKDTSFNPAFCAASSMPKLCANTKDDPPSSTLKKLTKIIFLNICFMKASGFVIPSVAEGSPPVIPNLIGNPDNRRLDSRSWAGMTIYRQRFLHFGRNDRRRVFRLQGVASTKGRQDAPVRLWRKPPARKICLYCGYGSRSSRGRCSYQTIDNPSRQRVGG